MLRERRRAEKQRKEGERCGFGRCFHGGHSSGMFVTGPWRRGEIW
jgi:hypothetical protein